MDDESRQSEEYLSIEDLPEELLEFILSLIPPYKDLHDCMTVSKKWRRCVLNVVKSKKRNFLKAINEFDIKWDRIVPVGTTPTITKRYSHTAVVHDNSMFVFGGCTSAMTTFNDLWMLNLSNRTWERPLAKGTYPSPKACSSLILYKDFLVLFGGWTYPPSYPLYQSWHLFNELHVYAISGMLWTCISTMNTPPPMAGHSVSVIGEWMIIFGGLQKPSTAVHCEKSNDIWKLNLETWTWYKQEVQAGPKPNGRFGQTQVVLDNKNLLILGGSGGPTTQHCDCWILNMEGYLWKWIKVEIAGKINEPTNIWSNPGCKIGDKIVVLNRIRQNEESPIVYYPRSHWNQTAPEDGRLSRIDLANRRPDRDENVNGRRGFLKNPKREVDDIEEEDRFISVPGPSGLGSSVEVKRIHGTQSLNMAAFMQPSSPSLQQNNLLRSIRLERLQKVEEKLSKKNVSITAHKKEKRTHYLGLYVLDISQALSKKPIATWLPPKNVSNGPEETILYTLVEGKSELIISQICNSLHFITSPTHVV
ncbi:hypothetical protein GWI33_004106 [Rhynchophorus ferrugineus]|uniref:F-box domain-containing protein n=1 Tax=Rhynchophorus ferrugineus TaxID=354439 RepID=A0A834MKM3_RHYFE|nr:hypothetical protein GWI33_004106 [Rhynchophorus ferrugineus]